MFAACMQTGVAYPRPSRAGWHGATQACREPGAAYQVADVDNAPLGALEGSELEGAFHAWIGRSRRRYIFTIAFPYELDHEALRNAVVVCASRNRNGRRRALFIGEPHEIPHGLRHAGAAVEVHYHLLATTRQARRAVIEDLAGVV